MYIFGALAPNRIMSGTEFTLRPSLAFSYIGSGTARHSLEQWALAEVTELSLLFSTEGATYIPRSAIMLGIGPYCSSYSTVLYAPDVEKSDVAYISQWYSGLQ